MPLEYSKDTHWEWHHRRLVVDFQTEKAKVAKMYMKVTELKQEIEILKEELKLEKAKNDK